MYTMTESQYRKLPKGYKGTYEDYQGNHPEWKGRRTALVADPGTCLVIEGVSLEIIPDS